MGKIEIKEWFKGREEWRTLNKAVYLGMFLIFYTSMFAFRQYTTTILLVIGFVLPWYIVGFLFHLRNMEKKDPGTKVVEGWITHAYGIGERVFYYPTKFELEDKLSPADLKDVKEYVKTLGQYGNALKIETGFSKFVPKQISYKEFKETDEMNEIERIRIKREEIEKYNKSVEEFNENKRLEQAKKPKIIDEDDLKNV